MSDAWLSDGERWRLIHSDCLEAMKVMPSSSAHSLVCDPPAGIAFMNADWDGHKGGRGAWVAWLASVMAEALRVLKPGAHGLVWAMPRTQHWTMCALEDAGFAIRDVIAHINGQGWPKGSNASLAIDRKMGAAREGGTSKAYAGRGGRPVVPKTQTETYGVERDPGGDVRVSTAPATAEAQQWDGWHSGLKPAFEPWILVQKPFKGSVADNLLAHGVGALNIDGCRIAAEGGSPSQKIRADALASGSHGTSGNTGMRKTASLELFATTRAGEALGRYPSNAIFSHNADCTPERGCTFGCAVYLLDRQAGHRKSGAMRAGVERKKDGHNTYEQPAGVRSKHDIEADEGGASRFFYCPKAKAASSRGGAGNTHPTVKHPELMAYLCRLVTPKDGVILDPFAGSGSTGVAALAEGFRFIGIGQSADYVEIARTRLRGGIVERAPKAAAPAASEEP